MEPDRIDVILEQRQKERPDLDLTPMGVFGRIGVLARVLESRVDAAEHAATLQRLTATLGESVRHLLHTLTR